MSDVGGIRISSPKNTLRFGIENGFGDGETVVYYRGFSKGRKHIKGESFVCCFEIGTEAFITYHDCGEDKDDLEPIYKLKKGRYGAYHDEKGNVILELWEKY